MYKRLWLLFIPCIMFIAVFTSYPVYRCYSEQKTANNNTTVAPKLNKEDKELGATDNQTVDIPQDFNQKDNIYKFFGVWNLDRIVLESNNYKGEKRRDGRIFSENEYLGYEVEYTLEFFRLGDQKFLFP